MQLEYVDVVFANRPDSNTPMEGEWSRTRTWGLLEDWGRDNACCSETWEGEKYWQDRCSCLSGDLWLWPKGFVFVVKCVCVSVRVSHSHTKISSTIFPHPLSSILVYQSPSLSFSVSVELPVSTGSLSCTRSQPSLFFRSRIIWPPRGKLVYFWAGLTRYKPYCALYSFNTLVQPFPHIYLMSLFISFTYFQFLPQ